MILQNTGNVVPQCLSNSSALILGQRNPAMLLIHAELAVKVASIYDPQPTSPSQRTRETYPD